MKLLVDILFVNVFVRSRLERVAHPNHHLCCTELTGAAVTTRRSVRVSAGTSVNLNGCGGSPHFLQAYSAAAKRDTESQV
jgi:hypothetical protein